MRIIASTPPASVHEPDRMDINNYDCDVTLQDGDECGEPPAGWRTENGQRHPTCREHL